MIALIGIAGCGKSTQRKLLADQLSCPWVYPGDLLRQNLVGQQLANLQAGKHIDDDITIPLLQTDFISKDAKHKQCILDGAPRTLKQAEWFAGLLNKGEIFLTGFIHLTISPKEAKNRLQGRERTDDTLQAIDERFKVYQTLTRPVVDYLSLQGITVHEIDGTGSPQQVNDLIRGALGLPAMEPVV